MQLRGSIEIDGTLSGRLQQTDQGMTGSLSTGNQIHGELSRVSRSYNELKDLPKINHVTVVNDKPLTDFSLRPIYYKTAEEWNADINLISEEGAIYIYTYGTGDDVKFKMKIGDGAAFLIDLPFVVDEAVSSVEKEFWDNKVSAYISRDDTEELVLSKDSYMINGEIIYA